MSSMPPRLSSLGSIPFGVTRTLLHKFQWNCNIALHSLLQARQGSHERRPAVPPLHTICSSPSRDANQKSTLQKSLAHSCAHIIFQGCFFCHRRRTEVFLTYPCKLRCTPCPSPAAAGHACELVTSVPRPRQCCILVFILKNHMMSRGTKPSHRRLLSRSLILAKT